MNEFHWIEIPGIGLLSAVLIKASIDETSQTIFPSRLQLHYDPRAHQKTEEMVEHMVTETAFDADDIEQSIANLVLHLGNELRVRKEVLFEPFGKLFYSKESNVLQFQATDKNIHNQFFKLESHPLIPLAPKLKNSITDTLFSPPSQDHIKSKGINQNLLILLAFLWIVFLGLLMCPSRQPSPKQINSNLPKEDTIRAIHPVTDSIDENKIFFSSDSSKTSFNDSLPIPDKDKPIITQKEFTNEHKIKKENIEELNHQIQHKKCVIIVGSFKKSGNAKRMITKIKHGKYLPYTENFGEFHRVGVKFDCTHVALEKMLEKLKEKFSGDAWILKY